MSLFYGKRKCNRVAGSKRCIAKIKRRFCPCLIDMKLYGHPVVLDSGGCILTIQSLLQKHCYLLINTTNNGIDFYCSEDDTLEETKKNFLEYRVYPAIEGGKKCLP